MYTYINIVTEKNCPFICSLVCIWYMYVY